MIAPIRTLEDVRQLVIGERKRRRLTQAETAGLINHTQKWLSQFETGKVDPPASMVFHLMTALGFRFAVERFDEGEEEQTLTIEDGL